ncbi:hypothetical protein PsYK624_088830 [Phanerochaete sordida]|uniref:Uncharacterized protein n=1 Tax=Phanerochaete sordida TaxID=48140 RepID=A0A9P3LG54_9APHY|nr:hypothetical protein PsYK624_088830 [Phanerochaete sordida]
MTLPPLAPATTPYFTSVLARVREAHPDFPLEPAILQSLLLCLIANGAEEPTRGVPQPCKHLILRTHADDVGLVLNLTTLILTTIFGFPTNKYKAKAEGPTPARRGLDVPGAPEHPADILRRIFIREKHTRHGSSADARHRARRSASGQHARRSSTLPATSPTDSGFFPPSVPASFSPSGMSSSLPSPLPTPTHSREGTADSQTDATSVASARRPPASPVSTLRMRPHAPRMQTEPIAVRRSVDAASFIEHARTQSQYTIGSLPCAVVAAGLEHVEVPAQRLLLRALQYRRVPLEAPMSGSLPDTSSDGALELPADFIMVYVCPLDPCERPAILETLLDRFAMSADIAVALPVRQAYTAFRSSVNTPLSASFNSLSPRMQMSALHPLDTPPVSPSPRLRPLPLGSTPQLNMSSATPVITPDELAHLRQLVRPVPPVLPPPSDDAEPAEAYTFVHQSLELYLADLFAAARHHPLLDGGLLTLRAHRDAAALVRAHRVLAGGSLGAELVCAVAAAPAAPSTRASESAADDDSDEARTEDAHAWGAADDAWLGAELRAGRRKASSVRSVEVRVEGPEHSAPPTPTPTPQADGRRRDTPGVPHAAFASRESFAPTGSFLSPLPLAPEVWDASEVDVGRVFPRVVSHRLRVRTGPDDEILGSIMHPAVREVPAQGEAVKAQPERKTVKQIVVGILADV